MALISSSNGGGGIACAEVIGYTTNALTPHNTELDTMVQASADLAGMDPIVVGVISPAPAAVLSTAQVDVIEEFVNNGGKLVYLGENFVFFNINTAVGGRFEIVYPMSNPPEVVLADIKAHPITMGPFGVVGTFDGSRNQPGAFGSMISPGPDGVSIIHFPGGDSAAVVIAPDAHAPGSGPIIAYSDINAWHDNLYLTADNRALWRNTFAYCPTPAQPCPWDCDGTENTDGTVGIVDFLALLSHWGQIGTSCDFDGGGVGITDFLALLGNWGSCP